MCFSGVVAAAGYQLREQSTSAAGNAFAGRGAQITDASLIYSNPAALTELSRAQLTLGGSWLTGSSHFSNASASNAAGLPVSGPDSGEVKLDAVVPHLFYSTPLNQRWSAGIGLFVPFGLSSDYDADFVGRYFARETGFSVYALQPTLAYRVSERLSIGGGISINYAQGVLSKNKDHSGMCESEAYLNQAYGMPVYQAAYCDSVYEVEGDDWGVGLNLGVHWRPTPSTRVALVYQSEVNYTLKGDSTITNTPITGANVGDNPMLLNVGDTLPAIDLSNGLLAVDPRKTEASRLKLTTPQQLSLSLDQQLTPAWSVQASAQWTEWSAFKHIVIESEQQGGSISASTQQPQNLAVSGYIGYIPEYWQDTWAVSVGTSYALNDAWQLKLGVSWDQDPTTDAHRTARVPTADRWWYAAGARWQLAEAWAIDLAYAYMAMEDTQVNEFEYNGLDQQIYNSGYSADYQASAHMLSLQATYLF